MIVSLQYIQEANLMFVLLFIAASFFPSHGVCIDWLQLCIWLPRTPSCRKNRFNAAHCCAAGNLLLYFENIFSVILVCRGEGRRVYVYTLFCQATP